VKSNGRVSNTISCDHLGLTHREAEVLSWVADGKTNAEVGEILGVSSRTIQKHLEHIFEKLGVETRTAAAVRLLSRSSSQAL
jgi:DNA-binding CsgD family transcriptional regulator